MKKLVLILALALTPLCAKAQLLLGGNLGITTNGDKVGIYIAPEVGYNFNRWVMAGGLVSYESTMNKVGFEPYVRSNFGYIANVVNFLIELSAPMGWAENYEYYSAVLRPGIAVRVSPHVALVAKIGAFGYFYEKSYGDDIREGWDARVNGNTISLGCYFNF